MDGLVTNVEFLNNLDEKMCDDKAELVAENNALQARNKMLTKWPPSSLTFNNVEVN